MKSRKTRKLIMYGLMVSLLVITVAYAALQTALNINGTVTKKGGSWNIYFDNPIIVNTVGDAEITLPDKFSNTTTSFDFDVTVVKPADSTTFTIDVVNDGTLDAELDLVTLTGVTEAEAEDVICTITYSDGTSITKGDVLKKNTRKSLKLTVTYDEKATTLSSEDVKLNIGVTLIYVQASKGTITDGTDSGGDSSYDSYDNLPIFVDSIEECTDTRKKYVLPDGYLYQYTNFKLESTNIFDINTASLNQRLGSSGTPTATNGALLLDYVEVDMSNDYTVNISGVPLTKVNTQLFNLSYWDLNKNKIGATNSNILDGWTSTDDGYTFTLDNSTYPNTKYIRIWLGVGGDDTSITEDDVKDLVVELSYIAETQEYNLNKVDKYVPADWYTEVKTTVSTIDNLKANAGSNTTQFLLTSDIHYSGDDAMTQNIGKVSAEVLRNSEIPFFMNVGDSVSQDQSQSLTVQEQQINYVINTILAPIPQKNILLTVGNHDGATGQREIDGTTVYYRTQMTNEKRAEVFFDWQKQSNSNKKFGPDGSYYYIDDVSTKTRYIMLNSFWTEWEGEDDGFVTDIQHSFFHNKMFGQEQLSWFANEALDMPSGYSAVIGTHSVVSPLDGDIFNNIISAYVNKGTYTGSYTGAEDWQNYTISVDYSFAKGELIAIFQGHNHKDAIDVASLVVPVINITTAGANHDVRDENAPTRTAGTATETAIDVVTIDKDARKIYLTRLGVGEDRVVEY